MCVYIYIYMPDSVSDMLNQPSGQFGKPTHWRQVPVGAHREVR